MTQRLYRPPVRRPARPVTVGRPEVPRDRPDKNPFHTHGSGDHFTVLSAFSVKAQDMALDSGTRMTVGTYPNAITAVNLAKGVTQGVSFLMFVPPNFVSNMDLNILWSPSADDALSHSVVWSRSLGIISAAVDVTGSPVFPIPTQWTSTAQANTANVAVVDTVKNVSIFDGILAGGTLNGAWVRFSLRRLGADAADTYVGDVRVHGIRFDFVGSN